MYKLLSRTFNGIAAYATISLCVFNYSGGTDIAEKWNYCKNLKTRMILENRSKSEIDDISTVISCLDHVRIEKAKESLLWPATITSSIHDYMLQKRIISLRMIIRR